MDPEVVPKGVKPDGQKKWNDKKKQITGKGHGLGNLARRQVEVEHANDFGLVEGIQDAVHTRERLSIWAHESNETLLAHADLGQTILWKSRTGGNSPGRSMLNAACGQKLIQPDAHLLLHQRAR